MLSSVPNNRSVHMLRKCNIQYWGSINSYRYSHIPSIVKLKPETFFKKKVSNGKSLKFLLHSINPSLFFFFLFELYRFNIPYLWIWFIFKASPYLIIWSYTGCSKSRCYVNHFGKKEVRLTGQNCNISWLASKGKNFLTRISEKND